MRKVEADKIALNIQRAYPEIDVLVSNEEKTDIWYLSLWTRDNKNYFMINTIAEWLLVSKVLSVFNQNRERI